MYEESTTEARTSRIERGTYDPESDDSLAVAVAETVARADGVSPGELSPRVYDAVDPDALERLFEPTDSSAFEAEVRFPMAEYEVVVRNTGEIFVSRKR